MKSKVSLESIVNGLATVVLATALSYEPPCQYEESSHYAETIQLARMLPNTYTEPDSYHARWDKERRDVLKFSPATTLFTFPLNGNRGLYGYTFRDGKVALRQDLIDTQDKEKYNTDLHESGHTPDERETRYITEEKIKALFPVFAKYGMLPPGYRV